MDKLALEQQEKKVKAEAEKVRRHEALNRILIY